MRPSVLVIALVSLCVGALVSCGGKSEADQAHDDACNAVTDIGNQVKQLQNYTVTTVTSDKVNGNINSIKADLKTIKDSLPKLESSLKSQLQAATSTFNSELSKIASNLGSSTSIQSAASQITTAANTLEQSYNNAFASVSC